MSTRQPRNQLRLVQVDQHAMHPQNTKVPAAPMSGQASASRLRNNIQNQNIRASSERNRAENYLTSAKNHHLQDLRSFQNMHEMSKKTSKTLQENYSQLRSLQKNSQSSRSLRHLKYDQQQPSLTSVEPREAFTQSYGPDGTHSASHMQLKRSTNGMTQESMQMSDFEIIYQRTQRKDLGPVEHSKRESQRVPGVDTNLEILEKGKESHKSNVNRKYQLQNIGFEPKSHQVTPPKTFSLPLSPQNLTLSSSTGAQKTSDNICQQQKLSSKNYLDQSQKSSRPSSVKQTLESQRNPDTNQTSDQKLTTIKSGRNKHIVQKEAQVQATKQNQLPKNQKPNDININKLLTSFHSMKSQPQSSGYLQPEDLIIKKKTTEPDSHYISSSQLNDLMLEQRPSFMLTDQAIEHSSQENVNNLTFQYSNPVISNENSPAFGNQSDTQNNSNSNNQSHFNPSLETSNNLNDLKFIPEEHHVSSEEKLKPLSQNPESLVQTTQSPTKPVAPHTSRGIHINIENYQAHRKAKLNKYNSLLGSLDGLGQNYQSYKTENSMSSGSLYKTQFHQSQHGQSQEIHSTHLLGPPHPQQPAKNDSNNSINFFIKQVQDKKGQQNNYIQQSESSQSNKASKTNLSQQQATKQTFQGDFHHDVRSNSMKQEHEGSGLDTNNSHQQTQDAVKSVQDTQRQVQHNQFVDKQSNETTSLSQQAEQAKKYVFQQAQQFISQTPLVAPPQSQRGARDKIIVGKNFEQSNKSSTSSIQNTPNQISQLSKPQTPIIGQKPYISSQNEVEFENPMYSNNKKHLVMEGTGALNLKRNSDSNQLEMKGQVTQQVVNPSQFDPNIFKGALRDTASPNDPYSIQKQRNKSMPSRSSGGINSINPSIQKVDGQMLINNIGGVRGFNHEGLDSADIKQSFQQSKPLDNIIQNKKPGVASSPTTNISCERFNCITKFAYATSVGHQPLNPHKQNQDSYILVPNMLNQLGLHFFAVCDGHGAYGHHVSQYLKEKLPLRFQQHLELYQGHIDTQSIFKIEEFYKKIPQYLHNCYNLLHQELGNSKIFQYDTHLSGSTCCSVLFDRNTVFCANAGDSRAVLYSFSEAQGGMIVTPMSVDHKPEMTMERRRIEKMGGRVDPIRGPRGQFLGPKRVWLRNQETPGLAMSRSIGDMLAHMVGVSTDPEVMRFELEPEHKFIVIASDGVWEFLSNEQIGKIVWPYFKNNSPEQAGNAIVRAAAKKWRQNDTVIDDITCVTIFLEVDCKIPSLAQSLHQMKPSQSLQSKSSQSAGHQRATQSQEPSYSSKSSNQFPHHTGSAVAPTDTASIATPGPPNSQQIQSQISPQSVPPDTVKVIEAGNYSQYPVPPDSFGQMYQNNPKIMDL